MYCLVFNLNNVVLQRTSGAVEIFIIEHRTIAHGSKKISKLHQPKFWWNIKCFCSVFWLTVYILVFTSLVLSFSVCCTCNSVGSL